MAVEARGDDTATDLGPANAASQGSHGATSPRPQVDRSGCWGLGSSVGWGGSVLSTGGGQLASTRSRGLAASLGPIT